MNSTTHVDFGARVDFFLDITEEVCPMTFVRSKLLIEQMASGHTAVIRLRGREPLANVPAAVRRHGVVVVELRPEDEEAVADSPHRLTIRKP